MGVKNGSNEKQMDFTGKTLGCTKWDKKKTF